jgi:hypothetical protein
MHDIWIFNKLIVIKQFIPDFKGYFILFYI